MLLFIIYKLYIYLEIKHVLIIFFIKYKQISSARRYLITDANKVCFCLEIHRRKISYYHKIMLNNLIFIFIYK